MFIRELSLRNFRNYAQKDFSFSPGFNLVKGRNGRGKSNLVEAVFLLSTSKSYRNDPDRRMIRWRTEGYLVRGLFVREGDECELSLAFDGNSKHLYINGNREERVSSIIGYAYSVLFSQEDSLLVNGPPGRRRSFLDLVLCTVDPLYFSRLRTYLKLVRQKNSVLRSGDAREDVLAVWNEQLAETGSAVMERRVRFVAFLDRTVCDLACRLGAGGGARISYEPSVPMHGDTVLKTAFLDELKRAGPRELRLGQAVVGPHRDDFSFFLGDIELRSFGSAGQARLASILLRMSQAAYYRKTRETQSVLLLDDVLHELDMENRERVLGLIDPGSQVIMTATDRAQVPETRAADLVLSLDEEKDG